jgi:hypothetical protein
MNQPAYQAMFGAETVKREHPGLLIAGGQALGELLAAIASWLESRMVTL